MLATIRLTSGLVLFAYVGTHLINHSWGLASMEALNIGRDIFVTVWRSWPGTILLYGALLTHFILILWSLYNRRSFRVRIWEAAQILLGLAIPFLLAEHALGTRGLNAAFGVIDDYIYEILVLSSLPGCMVARVSISGSASNLGTAPARPICSPSPSSCR